MAALTCTAVHLGVAASARATVALRGVAAAMPRCAASANNVFMAGSASGRRGLALTAARGRKVAGARGFEVVAQAISEVRDVSEKSSA